MGARPSPWPAGGRLLLPGPQLQADGAVPCHALLLLPAGLLHQVGHPQRVSVCLMSLTSVIVEPFFENYRKNWDDLWKLCPGCSKRAGLIWGWHFIYSPTVGKQDGDFASLQCVACSETDALSYSSATPTVWTVINVKKRHCRVWDPKKCWQPKYAYSFSIVAQCLIWYR